MRLTVEFSGRMKKDFDLAKRRGKDMEKIRVVIEKLANLEPLEPKYCDHGLSRNYEGCRECHIAPDWLLVYKVKEAELILLLMRTGSHSDLF